MHATIKTSRSSQLEKLIIETRKGNIFPILSNRRIKYQQRTLHQEYPVLVLQLKVLHCVFKNRCQVLIKASLTTHFN